MQKVQFVAYRYLTDADYFNIYKPSGTEIGGGGQTYIDFPVDNISIKEWNGFFHQVNGLVITKRAQGNCWKFPIYSIGAIGNKQNLEIYQRRKQSISISSQNINTRRSNRVEAWKPASGFPKPNNPNVRKTPRGLAICLVRTDANEIWASWFDPNAKLVFNNNTGLHSKILTIDTPGHHAGDASMLDLRAENVLIDETTGAFSIGTPVVVTTSAATTPVVTTSVATTPAATTPAATTKAPQAPVKRKQKTEAEIVESLFAEDEETEEMARAKTMQTVEVRERNKKAVAGLKQLYKNECQITGNQYAFVKKDGTKYSEVHHLVPLGEGGADKPINLVVLCPMLHRMLHYAEVEGIDLTKIVHDSDGSAQLKITINKKYYVITWHPEHAKLFQK